MLYRAFMGTPYTVAVLKELDLWEIAVLLKKDTGRVGPLHTYAPPPPGTPATGPRLRDAD